MTTNFKKGVIDLSDIFYPLSSGGINISTQGAVGFYCESSDITTLFAGYEHGTKADQTYYTSSGNSYGGLDLKDIFQSKTVVPFEVTISSLANLKYTKIANNGKVGYVFEFDGAAQNYGTASILFSRPKTITVVVVGAGGAGGSGISRCGGGGGGMSISVTSVIAGTSSTLIVGNNKYGDAGWYSEFLGYKAEGGGGATSTQGGFGGNGGSSGYGGGGGGGGGTASTQVRTGGQNGTGSLGVGIAGVTSGDYNGKAGGNSGNTSYVLPFLNPGTTAITCGGGGGGGGLIANTDPSGYSGNGTGGTYGYTGSFGGRNGETPSSTSVSGIPTSYGNGGGGARSQGTGGNGGKGVVIFYI